MPVFNSVINAFVVIMKRENSVLCQKQIAIKLAMEIFIKYVEPLIEIAFML